MSFQDVGLAVYTKNIELFIQQKPKKLGFFPVDFITKEGMSALH